MGANASLLPPISEEELSLRLSRCSVARLPPGKEARGFAHTRLTAGLPFSQRP
jgi:hypothetical protein